MRARARVFVCESVRGRVNTGIISFHYINFINSRTGRCPCQSYTCARSAAATQRQLGHTRVFLTGTMTGNHWGYGKDDGKISQHLLAAFSKLYQREITLCAAVHFARRSVWLEEGCVFHRR